MIEANILFEFFFFFFFSSVKTTRSNKFLLYYPETKYCIRKCNDSVKREI